MLSRELVIWMLTGATTLMWGIWARMSATLMEAPAGLMPMKLLVVLGRTNMSMPMPLVRSLKPLSLPMRMAVMERIMMTSMAMARQLMRERRGRWTRLPTTNLFMLLLVYGNGTEIRYRGLRSQDQRQRAGLSGLRRCGREQPAGNGTDRRAAANRNAFGADEESSHDGHDIGSRDRSKDDAKCGVETHINDGVDIALGSRMREEHHDEEPPWRLADVSAERVEHGEKEKPYRGGKQ